MLNLSAFSLSLLLPVILLLSAALTLAFYIANRKDNYHPEFPTVRIAIGSFAYFAISAFMLSHIGELLYDTML
ncbi:MAG: hypothetical protein ABF760_04190 [Zymomonas mobilis]|uniref:Uncharacterized protein n=1 Tax=Zymomonas mobilis TaxID=542 RepID=A0A542VZ83_ZYMMB|nr:hypothetical protein [Zymomonas mobilis]TQL16636.1 hypothetical protein FBY58_0172 [Zymomonas mobilis]